MNFLDVFKTVGRTAPHSFHSLFRRTIVLTVSVLNALFLLHKLFHLLYYKVFARSKLFQLVLFRY